MRVRKMAGTLGAALLALSLAACGGSGGGSGGDGSAGEVQQNQDFPAGSKMAQLAKAGEVTVGVKFDQPLFGQKALDGSLEGFDVEIAERLAADLGIPADKIHYVETVSANREPFLQQEKVDFVVATYTINEERDKVVDFAGPYYVAGQDIMVKKGNPLGIKGPDDLAGKKVCSVTGSTPAQNIRDNYPEAAKNLTLFDDYSKCADALKNGQVDAVTTDNVILSGFVYENKNDFELIGKTFTEEPYGIGVHQTKDKAFCEWINDSLDKMYQDGEWAKAYEDTIGKVAGRAPTPPKTGSCTTPGAE